MNIIAIIVIIIVVVISNMVQSMMTTRGTRDLSPNCWKPIWWLPQLAYTIPTRTDSGPFNLHVVFAPLDRPILHCASKSRNFQKVGSYVATSHRTLHPHRRAIVIICSIRLHRLSAGIYVAGRMRSCWVLIRYVFKRLGFFRSSSQTARPSRKRSKSEPHYIFREDYGWPLSTIPPMWLILNPA